MDMNPDNLVNQEALVDRLKNRMIEPHRSNLFSMLERRRRQAIDRIGPSDRDRLMAEMYLMGVNDGSEMYKSLSSIGQGDALQPGKRG